MVESQLQLDYIFTALSDKTRRSILERVAQTELSIGEIAQHYTLTFAAISKHIQVLEQAKLIGKKRRGKEQVVFVMPDTLEIAQRNLMRYGSVWIERFDSLDKLLKEMEEG